MAVTNALKVLRVVQGVYLHPLQQHVLPKIAGASGIELARFKTAYHALVAVTLQTSRFWTHLSTFLRQQTAKVLGPKSRQDEETGEVLEDYTPKIEEARMRTAAVMETANEVGLGGSEGQRVFADVMSEALTEHVNNTCAGKWAKGSPWLATLRAWVQEEFARFAHDVLSCLNEDSESEDDVTTTVTLADVRHWQERAVVELGLLRLRELFDIIVDWNGDTSGGIEDLEHYITTATARTHLVTHFSAVLSQRLLQPGASTTQILQVYISIIRAFAVLDPRGVLIDRLARPIRRYLRDREDTVRIIVCGLLADPDEDAANTDALVELAVELKKSTASADDNDEDLDWDNNRWMPYPVDAGPGRSGRGQILDGADDDLDRIQEIQKRRCHWDIDQSF